MIRLINLMKLAFTGFLTGMLLTVLLNQWTWLDMRVNIALLIPMGAIFGGAASFISKGSKGLSWLLVPHLALLATLLIIYRDDYSGMIVFPAILLREGLFLNPLSLFSARLLLIVIVITGNALWLFGFIRRMHKGVKGLEHKM